jgi:hypothetical protein
VTAGGAVAFLAVARGQYDFQTAYCNTRKFLLYDSGGGTVHFELHHEIEPDATWIAVDVATGRCDVESRGMGRLRGPLPPGSVQLIQQDAETKVRTVSRAAEVLVVRPGEAVWAATTGDRVSGAAGVAFVAPSALRELKTNAAPPGAFSFASTDIVVLVDPLTLQWFSPGDTSTE